MKSATTILVVDDEPMMQTLLSKILSREGYTVLTAGDGKQALEVMQNNKVDIVLSDIKMPHMDGFELLANIRHNFKDVGAIIMTAFGDTYSLKDALLLGADEYITKPFKSFEVAMVVERAYWRLVSARNQTSGATS